MGPSEGALKYLWHTLRDYVLQYKMDRCHEQYGAIANQKLRLHARNRVLMETLAFEMIASSMSGSLELATVMKN